MSLNFTNRLIPISSFLQIGLFIYKIFGGGIESVVLVTIQQYWERKFPFLYCLITEDGEDQS